MINILLNSESLLSIMKLAKTQSGHNGENYGKKTNEKLIDWSTITCLRKVVDNNLFLLVRKYTSFLYLSNIDV